MKKKGSVVTIGVFDGVHIGHKAVIREAVKRAKDAGLTSIVVTFDPHPLKVLSQKLNVASLISLKHRIKLIKALGIERVFVMKFGRRIANMSAEDFVKDVVIDSLGAKEIFVGEGFSFGKGAKADTDRLKAIGEKFGINIEIIKHIKKGGQTVSSSRIRHLIVSGRIKEAGLLLGRPYSILGTIVSGSRLGHLLGYPTANINPHHEAIPPSGVYAVKIKFKEKFYNGVMNIGVRPTFYDHGRDEEPSLEVHIFNFNERIYGKDLEIIFVKKLRNEKKFKKIDSLIEQIKRDANKARRSFTRKLLYK